MFVSCSKQEEKIVTILTDDKIETQMMDAYKEGLEEFNNRNFLGAAKKFNEAELLFPQSEWAPKAALMSAYSYFYDDYSNDAIYQLERFIKNFFDNNGFPLSRNPNDLVFFSKYLIFCKEVIKDSQKYVPEFLEDIIEKNLNCIQFIKSPNDQLPLFNGANSFSLNQINKYL